MSFRIDQNGASTTTGSTTATGSDMGEVGSSTPSTKTAADGGDGDDGHRVKGQKTMGKGTTTSQERVANSIAPGFRATSKTSLVTPAERKAMCEDLVRRGFALAHKLDEAGHHEAAGLLRNAILDMQKHQGLELLIASMFHPSAANELACAGDDGKQLILRSLTASCGDDHGTAGGTHDDGFTNYLVLAAVISAGEHADINLSLSNQMITERYGYHRTDEMKLIADHVTHLESGRFKLDIGPRLGGGFYGHGFGVDIQDNYHSIPIINGRRVHNLPGDRQLQYDYPDKSYMAVIVGGLVTGSYEVMRGLRLEGGVSGELAIGKMALSSARAFVGVVLDTKHLKIEAGDAVNSVSTRNEALTMNGGYNVKGGPFFTPFVMAHAKFGSVSLDVGVRGNQGGSGQTIVDTGVTINFGNGKRTPRSR